MLSGRMSTDARGRCVLSPFQSRSNASLFAREIIKKNEPKRSFAYLIRHYFLHPRRAVLSRATDLLTRNQSSSALSITANPALLEREPGRERGGCGGKRPGFQFNQLLPI